jgi:hypothetical protein
MIDKITKTNFPPKKLAAPAYAEKVNELIDKLNDIVPLGNVVYADSVLSNNAIAYGFPIWNGVDPSDWITFMDDFICPALDDVTGEVTEWAVTRGGGDASAAVTSKDGLGGWLTLTSDGDDNDDCYVTSRSEAFIFSTDKKMIFKARILLEEAATDDANWCIGLSDTVAADFLQDDGDGPAATYDGALFFKVDGTMIIQFETSNGGTQVTQSLATFVTDTIYNLAFVYDYNDGVTGYITPYVNGVAGSRHAITIAELEEMHLIMGVKSGGDNEETLEVDYVAVAAERR